MSDEIHIVTFNKNVLQLEMGFEGDHYETASVKFKLSACLGVYTLEESAAIPVMSLFNLAYLADVSVRLNAIKVEQELLRMQKFDNGKGKKRGKKD